METEHLANYSDAEEGEILSDDPDDLYIPLERPHIPSANEEKPSLSESEDDNLQYSSDDSDSSVKKSKIPKIKRKKFYETKPPVKKKNYNIWCSDLQTDVLTDSLMGCNVDKFNDRTRNVESYNYRLANHSNFKGESKPQKRYSGKRKHDGAQIEDKSSRSENIQKYEPALSNARNILGLSVTLESSEDEIAKDIANKLCENKEELILRALTILKKETVFSLFEETREIEASGGMLVMNGTRRRTPGGVFFYLLKTSETIPKELINLVFQLDKKSTAEKKRLATKKMLEMQAEKFKKRLSTDDFPTLLSQTKRAVEEFKAKKLEEDSDEVENPPPSPVTE